MEASSAGQFKVKVSRRSLGYDVVQRISIVAWPWMLLMALMAFPVGLILGIIQATEIDDMGDPDTIEALRHTSAGFIAIGFASVFGAISFAIGRILGQFRKGGGDLQESTGRRVLTLERPGTAWIFLGLMMMGMMTLIGAAVANFIFAGDVESTMASVAESDDRFVVVQGITRAGIGMYLLGIAFGLATIIQVLRFQAIRVRELVGESAED